MQASYRQTVSFAYISTATTVSCRLVKPSVFEHRHRLHWSSTRERLSWQSSESLHLSFYLPRAISLELVENLTTSSFLQAFRRHCSVFQLLVSESDSQSVVEGSIPTKVKLVMKGEERQKKSRGVVASRGRTGVALLRLALGYSVVPLC